MDSSVGAPGCPSVKGSPSGDGPAEKRAGGGSLSDLRGAAQLAASATVGTTRLVEAVHARILSPFRLRAARDPDRTGGLSGWIYRAIRGITRVVGWSTTGALQVAGHATRVAPSREMTTPAASASDAASSDAAASDVGGRAAVRRDRLVSVLNGVLGDHLHDTSNPLARSFSLRDAAGHPLHARTSFGSPGAPKKTTSEEAALEEKAASGGVLVVFVHGLCLSDRAWAPTSGRPGHVSAIAAATGGRPVFARYNTGRPIRANGRLFSRHLAALVRRGDSSPRIVLVAHSMGGLVVRSAFHHARQTSAAWPALVSDTVYLGTPHEGAPLERAGAWVEAQLRRGALTAPFTALTSLRSRGIQDLRHGAASGRGTARMGFASAPTTGRVLYAGATRSADPTLASAVGDGLVPLDSALRASDPSPSATRQVFPNLGHLELLRAPAVTADVCAWLSATDVSV